MKTLDKYILKSFLQPFFATFLIILFVLVMQALWMAFDSFAGKGIDIIIIGKFLWYTMLLVAPQALPIGVLLSSIMTLGSLSENYEFAAAKSAGISLQRIVRPLVFLAIFMSTINFMFYNYVYPYAVLKQINIKLNVKKKQPSMALVPGSFNSEIPNYQIKFDEKYGEEDNLLKNVMIYDLSANRGNQKIITAKKGKIITEEGSRYMTLVLNDGHLYEDHINNNTTFKDRKKMPVSYADFNEYTINIDVSSLMKDDLEDEKYTRNYNMLSLKQLKDTLPSMKNNYDQYVKNKAKSLYLKSNAKDLYKHPDSLIAKNIKPNLLDNFEAREKITIITSALSNIKRSISTNTSNKKNFKWRRKVLNHYDNEYYNRIALSLSCLLLFFIGAPLGSIIRKGGMGLPMVLAIAIYVIFHFSNTFGKNLAEESSVTSFFGSWLAVGLMLPLAIILTVRATNDKGLFDVNSFTAKISNFFKNIFSKRERTT